MGMYFPSTTAESLESARITAIEGIVTTWQSDLPFWRSELLGDPSVLGRYYTQQEFVARTALAVFPSAGKNMPPEIVAGSFCDWRAPDIKRMGNIIEQLMISVSTRWRTYKGRLEYMEWARQSDILPQGTYDAFGETGEMEAICATEGWPSAIFTLETVANDSPENPKPELAALYSPMIATPQLSLYSLKTALRNTGLTA